LPDCTAAVLYSRYPASISAPPATACGKTLFDVLSARSDLADSVWLDLYAGTGAVGIEALSRGARQVYFVESAKKHARLLRDNIAALDITAGFEVQEREVSKALHLLDSTGVVCDYCFLDPPYRNARHLRADARLSCAKRIYSSPRAW